MSREVVKVRRVRLLKIAKYVAIYLFLIIVFIYFSAPLTWLILASLNPDASPRFEVPKKPSVINYIELFETSPLLPVPPYLWIINSIIIATAVACITTTLSIISAYALTRYRFRGQSAMLTTFVILRLMPYIVIAIPILVMYNTVGLINTYIGVILVLAALVLPFTLLIAEGYFRTIPAEYEEAAMIDGCTRAQAFFKITLRLALPGIATMWLLSFVTAWGEFLMPYLILRNRWLFPASVGLFYVAYQNPYGRIDWGMTAAFSILYSIPVVIVFLFTQRYLRRGIAGLVTR